jgi:DNA-binding GntR family transcriptional regulator
VTTSAAQLVYADVRDRILDGRLRGGDVLSEVELAAEHGVSRTPVHEAMVRLETDEFLTIQPRRGAVVVPVSPHEARDLLELRHALESAAVRRLAGEDGAAGREALADVTFEILEHQRRLAEARDVTAFSVVDEAFHRAIVDASGNALAARTYAGLADRQRRMTVGAVGHRPEHLARLVDEHAHLARLVAERDTAAFDTALLAHLAGTHDSMFGLRLS